MAHFFTDSNGYHKFEDSDGNVEFSHRRAAENMLGRPLRSDEVVHHIDGDKVFVYGV